MTRFNLRSVFRSALLATAVLAAPFAHAQDKPGLPMWVIKDADTTIYVTGTVHMLPPGLDWGSEKLSKAMKDSKELWLEIAMGPDPMQFAMQSMPIMMRYAIATKPLSTLLTPDEYQQMLKLMEKSSMPKEMAGMFNMFKPWFVTMMLSTSPYMTAGMEAEEGIDIKLAKMATEDGDPIKGLETVDEQTRILASGSEEDQLAALRILLALPDEEVAAGLAEAKKAFAGWAAGDVNALDGFMEMDEQEMASFGGAPMDAVLKGRNENWAVQIEKMMKGSGVHFIAVGAGHLVGPDDLFQRLELRGIKASRY